MKTEIARIERRDGRTVAYASRVAGVVGVAKPTCLAARSDMVRRQTETSRATGRVPPGDVVRLRPEGPARELRRLLSATTHPKGGEAWSVELRGGARIGTLRRWKRAETSVRISNTSASWSKRDVTKWTAYDLAGGVVRVEESRIAALRALLASVSRG